MVAEAPPKVFVDAVVGEDGKVMCRCGRFLLELSDATLISILHTHRVRFYTPACKGCGCRAVIDFAEVQ